MSPDDAQAYCRTVTQQSGSNFYYSFLFLPRDRQDLMHTVYAFCREVDNAVDEPPQGSNPSEQVRLWRDEVAAAYHGTPRLPVTISLAHHLTTVDIPETYFQDVISGVEMDLSITRYDTFDDLYPYCFRVASVVGLICLKVFDTTHTATEEYATALGLAFQLTNMLRDVGSDAQDNRIYLPQEDLRRFGYAEHDLLAQRYTPQFVNLMAFECERARAYYRQAHDILLTLPSTERRKLLVAEIMRSVYSRILDQIERHEYRVFGPRISVPPLRRLGIATRVWLQSALCPRRLQHI